MESLLSALPLLACPLGMVVMMWLMGRSGRHQGAEPAPQPASPARDDAGPVEAEQAVRLARLHAELSEVEAEQAAIAEQIGRLPADGRAVETAPTRPAASGTESIGGER